MPLLPKARDANGEVFAYVRYNNRSPAENFLQASQEAMRKRFEGSFRAACIMGATYRNDERFKPLKGDGKPLWEFKEHDHRLYCLREQYGQRVRIVLFNGWVKDKGKGGRREETREITTAQHLYQEYVHETGGN